MAAELGAPVCANLVLLGFAAGSGKLICSADMVEATLRDLGGQRESINLAAFQAGLAEARQRRWG
jgi:indolepyruvate ferredoxin oxidoreductase beta subunit